MKSVVNIAALVTLAALFVVPSCSPEGKPEEKKDQKKVLAFTEYYDSNDKLLGKSEYTYEDNKEISVTYDADKNPERKTVIEFGETQNDFYEYRYGNPDWIVMNHTTTFYIDATKDKVSRIDYYAGDPEKLNHWEIYEYDSDKMTVSMYYSSATSSKPSTITVYVTEGNEVKEMVYMYMRDADPEPTLLGMNVLIYDSAARNKLVLKNICGKDPDDIGAYETYEYTDNVDTKIAYNVTDSGDRPISKVTVTRSGMKTITDEYDYNSGEEKFILRQKKIDTYSFIDK